MKVRLIMRKGIADFDGKCIDYDYITQVVEVKSENESPLCRPEIVGGEWLENSGEDNKDCHTCIWGNACNLIGNFLHSSSPEHHNYCSEYKVRNNVKA